MNWHKWIKQWKILVLAGIVLVPIAVWFMTRESPEHRIDREVAWKDVTPYHTTTHGDEVGSITVPGTLSG